MYINNKRENNLIFYLYMIIKTKIILIINIYKEDINIQ